MILECVPEDAKEVIDILQSCMVRGYRDAFPEGKATRNLVEAHSGLNWAEAKG